MPERKLSPRTPRLGALGAAITQLREKSGQSQAEVVERSGLHQTHVSGLERGLRNPTYDTLLALAEAMDTTPGELVTLADRIHRSSEA
jgi:transcriptional regulator with XRE-family HTH domain